MSTATPAPDDLGVVDPIRLPPIIAGATGRFARLPLVARVFGVLAIAEVVEILVRRFDWSAISADPSPSFGFVVGAAPSVLMVLLPVAVWTRRPDAARSIPLIARGAIAVAVGVLVGSVAALLRDAIFGGLDLQGASAASVAVAAAIATLSSLAGAIGLVWIGRGLFAMEQGTPGPIARRVGLLAATIIGVAVVAEFVVSLLQLPGQPPIFAEQGVDPAWQLIQLASLVAGLATLAWAYLAWVLVRTVDRPYGPRIARRSGVLAAGLVTLRALLTILSIVGLAWVTSQPSNTQADFDTMLSWQYAFNSAFTAGILLSAAASALFLGAFALGIHDESPTPAAQLPASA